MYFPQNLRRLLTDSGTSSYRLSKGLGVHQTTIKNWLDSKTYPPEETLRRIANFFGLPLSYLLADQSNPPEDALRPTPVLFMVRELIRVQLDNTRPVFILLEGVTCLRGRVEDGRQVVIRDLGSLCDDSDTDDLRLAIYIYPPDQTPCLQDACHTYNGIRYSLRVLLGRLLAGEQEDTPIPSAKRRGRAAKQAQVRTVLPEDVQQVAYDFMCLGASDQRMLRKLIARLKQRQD